jgi:hypothetical protein
MNVHELAEIVIRFFFSYWDKIIVAIVAIYGAVLSTVTAVNAWQKSKADKKASATALQHQIKSSDKGHKIMAKSALLASYNNYLSVLEDQNAFWRTQGMRGVGHDTSSLRKKIDVLEQELDTLTKTEDL